MIQLLLPRGFAVHDTTKTTIFRRATIEVAVVVSTETEHSKRWADAKVKQGILQSRTMSSAGIRAWRCPVAQA